MESPPVTTLSVSEECLFGELFDFELLGEGGYGVVHRAYHEKYGCVVYKKYRSVRTSDWEAEVINSANIESSEHSKTDRCGFRIKQARTHSRIFRTWRLTELHTTIFNRLFI